MVGMMANIVRVGIVGAPHSGKTCLGRHIKKYLQDDFSVILVEDVSDRLFRLGLDPDENISELDFQIECLKSYSELFEQVETYIDKYVKDTGKDIIVIYDTLPSMTQCFLSDSKDLRKWKKQFEEIDFSKYKIDLLFIDELLSGDYSLGAYDLERDFDIDVILTIAERVNYVFEVGERLENVLTLEEKVNTVIDHIMGYLGYDNNVDDIIYIDGIY